MVDVVVDLRNRERTWCMHIVGIYVIFEYGFCVCFDFKQKTTYDMRISDWSSDVCSSDLDEGCDPERGCAADPSAECPQGLSHRRPRIRRRQIGRASCRERVCQYV